MPEQSRDPSAPGHLTPSWTRLEDQIAWYSSKSRSAQRRYQYTKIAELIIAACIPIAAVAGLAPIATGALGSAVVVLVGIQQLFQWQPTWILYRSAAESLKHERYLYLAAAGPYATPDRALVLAERVERISSQEQATWSAERRPGTETAAYQPPST